MSAPIPVCPQCGEKMRHNPYREERGRWYGYAGRAERGAEPPALDFCSLRCGYAFGVDCVRSMIEGRIVKGPNFGVKS